MNQSSPTRLPVINPAFVREAEGEGIPMKNMSNGVSNGKTETNGDLSKYTGSDLVDRIMF